MNNDRLATRLEALSGDRRELLARRLGELGAGPGASGRLCALVVPARGVTLDVDGLRAYCADTLPDYMIPQRFAVVDALPRTPAGKLDRAALGQMTEPVADENPGGCVAPRDATETTLAGIWAEVLGTEPVGVNDDFFELGGDSLLSIRILARMRREGLDMSAEAFFDNATIAAHAAVVRKVSGTAGTPARSAGSRPDLGSADRDAIARMLAASDAAEE